MSSWRLREPLHAVQYQHGDNEHAVFAIVNARGCASFTNDRGHMRCWNLPEGGEAKVANGDWVVALGDSFIVVGSGEFDELFEKVD